MQIKYKALAIAMAGIGFMMTAPGVMAEGASGPHVFYAA